MNINIAGEIMTRFYVGKIRITGNGMVARVCLLLLVLCCVISGYMASAGLSSHQNAVIAEAVLGMGESAISKGWIAIVWWRLLALCISAACITFIWSWIVAVLAEFIMLVVWATGWGSLIRLCGMNIWLIIVYILAGIIFVVWMTEVLYSTTVCFKYLIRFGKRTVTPKMRLSYMLDIMRKMSRGFGWVLISTFLECGALEIAKKVMESGK